MMTDRTAKIHFGPEQQQLVQGRSDLIRESTTYFFDMTPVASGLNRGFFRTQSWFGRDCYFSHSDNDTLAVRRTKAQAESGAHLVLVQRFLSGHLLGRLEDLNVDRQSGEIYLVDLERRYECIQFPSSIQNIFISKPGHFTLQSFTHVYLFIHSYYHTCISRGHDNSEDMGWMDRFY